MSRLAVPRKFRETIEACVSKYGPCKNDLHAYRVINHLLWEHGVELPTLIDRLHPSNRPTILLHEGNPERGIPTVWLLGWSQCERTGLHGHGESAVAIGVVQGSIANIAAFFTACGAPTIAKQYIRKGSVLTLPQGAVHDVHGLSDDPGQRDVTVHAYWPPLTRMEFYDEQGSLLEVWEDGDLEHQRSEQLE